MNKNDKMTNVKALNYVKDNYGAELPQDVSDKIDAMIASFEKKAQNKKATKTQEENVGYKAEILRVLAEAENGMTVSEVLKASDVLGEFSNQKVSALMRQLIEDGKVEKTMDKKKSIFTVVAEIE